MGVVPDFQRSGGDWVDEESIRSSYWSDFSPGEVVMDIGAHNGLYSMPALAQGCRVHAVEPIQSILACLIDSAARNDGFTERLTTHNAFAYSGETYPEELMAHMLSYCPSASQEMHTVDELASGLDRLDAIKMDVEGGEYEVLKGASEVVRRLHPRLILIEDHAGLYSYCGSHNTSELCKEYLLDAGYELSIAPFHTRSFIVGTRH